MDIKNELVEYLDAEVEGLKKEITNLAKLYKSIGSVNDDDVDIATGELMEGVGYIRDY